MKNIDDLHERERALRNAWARVVRKRIRFVTHFGSWSTQHCEFWEFSRCFR